MKDTPKTPRDLSVTFFCMCVFWPNCDGVLPTTSTLQVLSLREWKKPKVCLRVSEETEVTNRRKFV